MQDKRARVMSGIVLDANQRAWPELPDRLVVGSGYPLANCGIEGIHAPHIVGSGDHAEWGPIFAAYHCDGGLPAALFDNPRSAPHDWRRVLPQFIAVKRLTGAA